MLSRREKIIGAMVGAALAVLAADWWLLTPYQARRASLERDLSTAKQRFKEITELAKNRPSVEAAWKKLEEGGMKSDPALGEHQATASLLNWAQQADVHLPSQSFERPQRVGDFLPVAIKAKAAGSGPAIGAFLYLVETAPFPMRIDRVQIVPTKEGTDDLTVEFTVTTAVFSAAPETKAPKPRTRG